MQGLNNEKKQITRGTSQRGSSRVNTARNMNDEELQCIDTEISVAKQYLKKAKDRNEDLKKSFYEPATHLEQFRVQLNHQTREYFMGHAKAILQPARDYYNKLFHK